MSKRYSIAFKGEIADGFEIAQVKQSFARQFRKSDPIVEKIFSGDQITLASDLEWDRAKSAALRLRDLRACGAPIPNLGSWLHGTRHLSPRPAATGEVGAPGRTRTCCLKIRSLALYPDELRARAE